MSRLLNPTQKNKNKNNHHRVTQFKFSIMDEPIIKSHLKKSKIGVITIKHYNFNLILSKS